MNAIPYLFFNGQCEDAAQFYATALGGEVDIIYRQGTLVPSREGPYDIQHVDVIVEGKVMLQITNIAVKTTQTGFAISLPVPSIAVATKLFDALAIGGTITIPFAPSYYSPDFGMLVDQFGVSWVITAVS